MAGGAYLDWSQARPGRGERDQQVDRDLPRKAADAGGLGGGAGLHWEHPPGDGRGQQDRRESSQLTLKVFGGSFRDNVLIL